MIAALRRRRADDLDEVSGSDMTPMIDVVFQLLIFFMLTMQFKEVEGKLLSQLPKNLGPLSQAVEPDLKEVRVLVRPADPPGAGAWSVGVDGHGLGRLSSTDAAPGSVAANKALYRAAGAKARELLSAIGGRRVILDASPEVPYEHVLGVVDGLKQAGVEGVEFAANPRFEKYYR